MGNAVAYIFEDARLALISIVIMIGGAGLAGRLFVLQVLRHDLYTALAARQGPGFNLPLPDRGQIYLRDMMSPDQLHPAAVNNDVYTVFIDAYLLKQALQNKNSKMVTDTHAIARAVANKLQLDEAAVYKKLTEPSGVYDVLKRQVPQSTADELKLEQLAGIGFDREPFRFYPEGTLTSHEVGFYGFDESGEPTGKYGVEGYMEQVLAGKKGYVIASSTSRGAQSVIADDLEGYQSQENGSDIVLTIDRTVQFIACNAIKAHMDEYKAKSASVIIMDIHTGAVIAMCNTPDFDPNAYQQVGSLGSFNNNAIFTPYEPGSVFKIITMAAALDQGKVTPDTTYTDTGALHYGRFIIRNAADKSYGVQTMTAVLKESINTGAVFAAERIGQDVFREYVKNFGFGELTGVEMDTEAPGNIAALDVARAINLATASFGQGITTTPIQLITAFSAVANQGKLMKPYVIDRIIKPDGTTEKTMPKMVRQVISAHTAKLLTGMMVVVVEQGHGKKAGVPGYYVAGKTGTAQIPDGHGGYGAGTDQTFIGFAPADHPAFAMLVKYEEPQRRFAEYTAVPVFGEIAKFLVNYLQLPPSFTPDTK